MAEEEQQTLDMDKLEKFVFHVYEFLEGAVVSGMIYLGDRLGLYRALADAGPIDQRRAGARKPACTSAGCASGCAARPRRA